MEMTFKALLYLISMKQKQILPIAEQTWSWDEGWRFLTQSSFFVCDGEDGSTFV